MRAKAKISVLRILLISLFMATAGAESAAEHDRVSLPTPTELTRQHDEWEVKCAFYKYPEKPGRLCIVGSSGFQVGLTSGLPYSSRGTTISMKFLWYVDREREASINIDGQLLFLCEFPECSPRSPFLHKGTPLEIETVLSMLSAGHILIVRYFDRRNSHEYEASLLLDGFRASFKDAQAFTGGEGAL